MGGGLRVVPLTLREANDMVSAWHRHHPPVRGHRFSIGVRDQNGWHGAVIVGRPVARAVDWRTTAEVTRLVTDGTANACSMLYGAAARAATAMGFARIQTYILTTEPGTSLRAAGWRHDHTTTAGSWNRTTRSRTDRHPTVVKARWCRDLRPASTQRGP